MSIQIIKLPDNRWQQGKALRLEALEKEPTAFGSSPIEENKLTKEAWIQRNANAYYATNGNELVGMIAHLRSGQLKTKHLVHIVGFYVKPIYRGKGVGHRLVEKVIEMYSNDPAISKFRLTVVKGQDAALELYLKHGFEVIGTYKKELHINGIYYDELVMEKYI